MPELPSRNTLLGIAGGLFVLLLFVYGASLGNDFVRFDDGLLIYENPVVREMSLRSVKTAFTTYDPELYIPLTLLSYKIDYLIGGTSPFLYHFHNLLLHTANAFLVLLLVYLLTGSRIGALIVSIFFAIHPLHTEAVVWASARKDLLSTLFFLLAILAYLFYRERCQVLGFRYQETLRLYVLSLIFFLLGLLSKVMILTLPLVLLLMDFREGRKWDRRMLLEKAPYFALSLLFGVVALYGKRAVTSEATVWETFLMAGKSAVFYLMKLFVPIHLSVLYPYTGTIALSELAFSIPLFVVFILLCITAMGCFQYINILKVKLHGLMPVASSLGRLRRDARNPSVAGALMHENNRTPPRPHSCGLLRRGVSREVTFGILFFLLTLFPTFINFSKDGEYYFASDRYAYIPSIGILYLIASFVLWFMHQKKFSILHSLPAVALAKAGPFSIFSPLLAIALLFSVLTFRQSLVWADTETLFRHVIAIYPNAHRAHNNIGNAHRRRGELTEAIAAFEQALTIRRHPKTLSNLGAVYRKQGRIPDAFALYREAIALAPSDPEPQFGLGIVYAQEGEFDAARKAYERALELDPAYSDAHVNLGALAMQGGDLAGAIASYERAIELQSTHVQAHFNLGVALVKGGEWERARAEYEHAVSLDPFFLPARLNLGVLLAQIGEREEASEQFEEVLIVEPGNALARSALRELSGAEDKN